MVGPMIAVIQCAATMPSNAGSLVTAAGKPVVFVADPAMAPPDTRRRLRPSRPVSPSCNDPRPEAYKKMAGIKPAIQISFPLRARAAEGRSSLTTA